MTSSSLVEIEDSATSTCPALPPPTGLRRTGLCWTSSASPGR